MRTRIFLCCLAFVSFAAQFQYSYADSDWKQLNSGTTMGLLGVHFINENRGYAVGEEGTLLKTTNGGTAWAQVQIPTTVTLWGVYAAEGVNGDIIYVVGDNGAVYKTVNSGKNWTQQDIHYTEGFTFGIYCSDPNTCFVAGGEGPPESSLGTIVRTVNGGDTWTKVSVPGTYSFDKTFSPDGTTGYAVGASSGDFSSGVIYKTTNGGQSWNISKTTPGGMNSVYCFDKDQCIAIGFFGLAYRTTDGGKTWNKISIAYTNALLHIGFLDKSTGFISAANGLILVTTDGGKTWSEDSFTGTASMWGLCVVAGKGVVYAVGDEGTIVKKTVGTAGPVIAASTSLLDFGEVVVGKTSERTVEITPGGSSPLTITTVKFDETSTGKGLTYTMSEPLPITLNSGQKLVVTVTLSPESAGAVETELLISSNDQALPVLHIPVTATVSTQEKPTVQASLESVVFGEVSLQALKEQTVEISAKNSAGLSVQTVEFNAPGAEQDGFSFTLSQQLPATLALGEKLLITVKFAPGKVGAVTAGLTIQTNDEAHSQLQIPIAGIGKIATDVEETGSIMANVRMSIEPNPLRTDGRIALDMPAAEEVSVEIFSLAGVRLETLVRGRFGSGRHTIALQTENLPTGIYLCRLQAGTHQIAKPIIIIR